MPVTIFPTEVDAGSSIPTIATVRVRAAAEQLSTLRGFTGTIALNHGFDVDAVADLELAIDETAGMLMPLATPGTDIVCTFEAPVDALRIVMSVTASSSVASSQHSFGWFVLEALTDSAVLEQSPLDKSRSGDASNSSTVTVTLLKNLLQRGE